MSLVDRGIAYGLAGASAGAFALCAAVLAPLRARWVDSAGPRLPLIAFSSAFLAITLCIGPTTRALAWAPVILAGAAGAVVPPLGAISKVALTTQLSASGHRGSAISIDTVVNNLTSFAAPITAAIVVTAMPWLIMPLSGALVFGGTIATSIIVAPPEDSQKSRTVHHHGLWVAEHRLEFMTIAIVTALVGTAAGAIEIAIPALAQSLGRLSLAGWLLSLTLAANTVAALLAGLWTHGRQIGLATMSLATSALLVGSLIFSLRFDLRLGLVGLTLIGIALGCSAVLLYLLADAFSEPGEKTVAMSWVASANNAGNAAGASAGGFAVDHISLHAAPLLAASVAAVGIGIPLFLQPLASHRRTHGDEQAGVSLPD
ncbi:MFS transporter [Kribbella sp. NPDC055110]